MREDFYEYVEEGVVQKEEEEEEFTYELAIPQGVCAEAMGKLVEKSKVVGISGKRD